MTAADPWSRGNAGQAMEAAWGSRAHAALELLPAQSAWVRDLRPRIRCRAHRSTDGGPCENYAIRGGFTCHAHGGMAPQARRAARYRLAEAATEALAARALCRLGIWPQAATQAVTARALRGLGIGP
jgi:hypothetical protein